MKIRKKISKQNNNFKQREVEFNDGEDYINESIPTKKWYDEIATDVKQFPPVTDEVLIELKNEAEKCLSAEVANYNIKNSKSNSNYRWMKTVLSKGPISEKIAASTISIQDNPLINLDMIRSLVSMVKVGKKNECMQVMETLTELCLSDLLKPNNRLKPFRQRPLSLLNEISSGNAITRKKYLSYWYFEDQLKEIYTSFVLALNTVAHDTLDTNKDKAIGAMFKLLSGNPEQEKNLLTYLVNKLGDPSQKVASKTMYCLSQLLYKHPNMQGVVLTEVEKMLFRPNVATKAQYYCLCFISQFYLSHDNSEVAQRLIQVYFSFFKACIKKGDVDTRMMSALLMGVNRAYPYAKLESGKVSEHIDTIYRVVHMASFNVSLHALSLLYQVSDYANHVNDRFYSALYKKLLDPKLGTTTHQAMLLNLVYKALLKDTEVGRVKAFIKRLLQVALLMQPSFTCGIIFLLSQIMSKKPGLHALQFKEIEDKFADDGDENYKDVKDEIVIKIEDDVSTNQDNENKTNIEKLENQEPEDVKPDIEIVNVENNITRSWFHCAPNVKKEKKAKMYDPMNRNPLYAGAEFCTYIELMELKNHYHPSVSLFAEKILKGEPVNYSGDPLKDFTLIRFLDRFVFKNPKKLEDIKQGSHPTFGKRKQYKSVGLRSLPVNSDNYLNQNVKNIPVDEMFMFTYLQRKHKDNLSRDDDDDEDLESVGSEEFEEMLHKMGGMKDLDDDIDFMNDIGNKLKDKKSKKEKVSDNNSGSEDEIQSDEDILDEDENQTDEDNFSDDLELEEDKDLLDDLDDNEMSDIVFDSEEESSDTKKIKKKLKTKDGLNSIFASAEEFASILEDEGSSRRAPGTSNAYSNDDNAGVKQLAWEEKRNQWIKGYSKAVGGKKYDNKRNKFNNKRPNKSKFYKNQKKQKTS